MTLDELVKDIDVQEVRDKNFTDEKVALLYTDATNVKDFVKKIWRGICIATMVFVIFAAVTFAIHLIYPEIDWLWRTY